MRFNGYARVFMVFATLACATDAQAHPPYERLAATITDSSGQTLQVVARYTGGILGTDPVTIVVRDAAGKTVAETERARDAHAFASCAEITRDL